MNKQYLIGLCILLLLAVAVSGVEVNHETTSVSRIVGETPSDMLDQLRHKSIRPDSATVFTDQDTFVHDQINRIVDDQIGTSYQDGRELNWYFSDVENDLDTGKDYVFVSTHPNSGDPYSSFEGDLDDVKDWNVNKGLFVFNSKYGGLHIPGQESFISTISSQTPTISALSSTSSNFVKSVACTMQDDQDIGDIFKQARNKYYLNTHTRSEFIGLTLLSYALYGLPTAQVNLPNWDTNSRQDICEDLDKGFDILGFEDFSIQSTSTDVFVKTINTDLGSGRLVQEGNHTLLETDSTTLDFSLGELVRPVKTEITQFPLKTVITNVTTIRFSDPQEFLIADLPKWSNGLLVDRRCDHDQKEASVTYDHSRTKDSLLVIAHIDPIEVVNCTEGRIRLYRQLQYKIEYVAYSPIMITDIEHPSVMQPDESGNVRLTVENTQSQPVSGVFVFSLDDEPFSLTNFTTSSITLTLPFVSPEEEGLYDYKIEFVYENETRTQIEFEVAVDVLDAWIELGEPGTSTTVTLHIINKLDAPISTTLTDTLSDDSTSTPTETAVVLSPGENTFTFTYDDLDRSQEQYDLLISIPYLSEQTSISTTLVTNRAPVISQPSITLYEGEYLNISPSITDSDNDAVTLGIDAPFAYNGSYQLSYEDSGEYTFTVIARDGITVTTKKVALTVLNTNRPPTIDVEPVVVFENETVVLDIITSDPDNNNSVSNDDNNLTVNLPASFENGSWVTTFDDSGEYLLPVSVSDGESLVTTYANVTVINLNRAPFLDNNSLSYGEGDLINLSSLVRDLDNENNASNDDNNLTVVYPEGFGENGVWLTGYSSSATYNFTVAIDDGIVSVNETVLVNISNVNRPPDLNSSDIAGKENETITIEYSIVDPDNLNNVSSDDNDLTVTFSQPFDNNGQWTPTFDDSGNHIVMITASDGITSVNELINVTVANVNRLPWLNGLANMSGAEGDVLTITPTYGDPDNENNASVDDNTLVFNAPFFEDSLTWNTQYNESGTYDIPITVSDGELNATQIVSVVMNNTNRAPVINMTDILANEGDYLELPIAYDPDNENNVAGDDTPLTVTYSSLFGDDGTVNLSYSQSGTYNVSVVADDGSYVVTENITVVVSNFNRPPYFSQLDDVTVQENHLVSVPHTYSDPDNENDVSNDDNNLSVIFSSPLNSSGQWQTSYDDGGYHMIPVLLTDGFVNVSRQVTVIVGDVNRPPTIDSYLPLQNIVMQEGESVDFSVTAADPDNNQVSYLWHLDNDEVSTNPTFNYNPSFTDSGTHTIRVRVSDPAQFSTTHSWTVQVQDVNHAPEFNVPSSIEVYENEQVVINISTTDEDGDVLDVAIDDPRFEKIGDSFVFDTSYDDSSNTTVVVTVSDGKINTTHSTQLVIYDVNREPALSIDSAITDHTLSLLPGEGKTLHFTGSDPDGDELVFSQTTSQITLEEMSADSPVVDNTSQYMSIKSSNVPTSRDFMYDLSFSDEGIYSITFNLSDGHATTTYQLIAIVSDRPVLHMAGITTDIDQLSDEDLSSIDTLVIDRPGQGKIEFLEPVDLSNTTDLVSTLLFTHSTVGIDSSRLPMLNRRARITFYDQYIPGGQPEIYYTSSFGLIDLAPCPLSVCTDVTYTDNQVSFITSHFSIYVVKTGERHSLVLPEILTVDYEDDGALHSSFEIVNDGDTSLDASLSLSSQYDITLSPSETNIGAGESRKITISGSMPVSDIDEDQSIGTITAIVGRAQATTDLRIVLKKPLHISDLDITVGDDKNSNLKAGEEIDVEPGAEIKVEIELENNFDDIDFEDVTIFVEAYGEDDETSEFTLRAGKTKDKTLSFRLPKDISDNELIISIEAEDVNGTDYEIELEIDLDVKKAERDVQIIHTSISPSQIPCDGSTTLKVVLDNQGRDDEKISLHIDQQALDVSFEEVITIFEDFTKTTTYDIGISDAQQGTWKVPITVKYDDGSTADTAEPTLYVKGCVNQKSINTVTSLVTEQKTIDQPMLAVPVSKTKTTTPPPDPLVFLVILIFLVNLALCVLLVVLKRR